MRRISYIAPVDAMQGNLSGTQDLRYALNNNKAYESPANKKNYAKNYDPRFIGSKISATGKKVFRVKTKSAVRMTAKATKAMALLGGAGAVYGALIKVKTTATYLGVLAQYNALVAIGEKRSFQQYCMDIIRQAIAAHAENVTFTGPATLAQFKNPWYDGTMTAAVTISSNVLAKFWTELNPNGINFSVEGQKGICNEGDDFDKVLDSPLNVLGLTSATVGQETYVKKGDLWLKAAADEYVNAGMEIEENKEYTLTTTAPSA